MTRDSLERKRNPLQRLVLVDWILIAAGMGLAWLLVEESRILWSKPHYQFFPISIIAFAWFAATRAADAPLPVHPLRKYIGRSLIAIGFCSGLFAAVMFSPWLAHAAGLMFVSAWCLLRLRATPWYSVLAWLSLLWVTLPLPLGLDAALVQQLQLISGRSASAWLDAMGVAHLPTGIVLELKGGKLFVDEACSGVNSLFALLAVALIISIGRRVSFIAAGILLASVPAWAWLGNTVRLVTIAVMLDWFEMDFAHGWKHNLLGLALMLAMCVLLIASLGAIEQLFKPFPVKTVTSNAWHAIYNRLVRWPEKGPWEKSRKGLSTASLPNKAIGGDLRKPTARYVGPSLVVALACLAVSVVSDMRYHRKNLRYTDRRIDPLAVHHTFTADDLPHDLGGMRQSDFKIVHRKMGAFLGEHSVVWRYQDEQGTVTVSLDFPFPGFHALEGCYLASGCKMLGQRRSIEMTIEGQASKRIEEVEFFDPTTGTLAPTYLAYMEFDSHGRDVWRASEKLTTRVLERIVQAVRFQTSAMQKPMTFQLQFYVTGAELNDQQKERYRRLLVDTARRMIPKVQQLIAENED